MTEDTTEESRIVGLWIVTSHVAFVLSRSSIKLFLIVHLAAGWTVIDHIHVQYSGIMRFTVLRNRHHEVSQSVPFFMHCKTVTILLRITVRGHFVMSVTKNHESHYVIVLDNPYRPYTETSSKTSCRSTESQWTVRIRWPHTTQECIQYMTHSTMLGQKKGKSKWLQQRNIHTWNLLGSGEDLFTEESRWAGSKLVSFAAVFLDVTEHCVTSKKRLRRRLGRSKVLPSSQRPYAIGELQQAIR